MATGDMTLDRLRDLLDAFGGTPARWPDAERDAALALLAMSAEARALRESAMALDTVLDRSPAAKPSDALAARVLAAAPARAPVVAARVAPFPARQRRARSGLLAGLGLAAAATLAIWLVRREATTTRPLDPAALAELGEYETPTDELLAATELDPDDTVPAFGCDDPNLDCDDAPPPRPAAMGPRGEKEMHA